MTMFPEPFEPEEFGLALDVNDAIVGELLARQRQLFEHCMRYPDDLDAVARLVADFRIVSPIITAELDRAAGVTE